MATFVETTVKATIQISRRDPIPSVTLDDGTIVPAQPAKDFVYAVVAAYTADGTLTRQAQFDITDRLTAAQQTGATNLLDAVIARVEALWGIA